jgi:UDP-3-O-[3-hydroxymyristoyl] N-acetylglucosamine deacetylase
LATPGITLPLQVVPTRETSLSNHLQFEHTIHTPLDFQGIGLHSGAPVSMHLIPAPAGSGIVFRRSDLDNFEIPATGRNVARVSYATSLMRQGVLIQTTEHLLSALIGLGVDNIIVEIDNLEVPILDGSSLPYVSAILSTGLKRQRRKREYIRILKPIEVRESSPQGDKFIGVYPFGETGPFAQNGLQTGPGEGYSIHYSIDFPAPIGHDTFIGDLEAGTYSDLIAPARTFGFKEDEAMLRDMGLIRGVSDDSAIIVTRTTPTQPGAVLNGPLRFPDEFVRHKVLDLIGDLALAGRRIWGRVVAERAGHAMHTALVQKLLRDRSAWELAHRFEPPHSAQPESRNIPELTSIAALQHA